MSLAPHTVIEQGAHGVTVATGWDDVALGDVEPAVLEGLRRMLLGPIAWTNLGGPSDVLAEALHRLRGSVVHHLVRADDGSVVLSAQPAVADATLRSVVVDECDHIRLSRFAAVRPADPLVVMQSPVADYAVTLDEPAVGCLIARLGASVPLADVAAATPGVEVRDVVGFLAAAGLVLVASDGDFAEDSDDALRRWSAHELDFYTRTRMTDAADEHAGVEPMAAPNRGGSIVTLHRPPAHGTPVDEIALTSLLETECVCPSFSGGPLPVDRLGELLYRAARVRSTEPLPLGREARPAAAVEASQRPYLSVALLFELEVYVAAENVEGLARGVHHYDPIAHRLVAVDDCLDLDDIVDTAARAATQLVRPAAVFMIAARRGRTDWVFGDASHAMSLVHAGALLQVLRLCAQAMDLSLHPVPPQSTVGWLSVMRRRHPYQAAVGQCVIDVPAPGAAVSR